MPNKIAYLCDGLSPNCSGKIGCFKCLMGNFNSDAICYHTLDPAHAVYGASLYPGVWSGIRFKAVPCGDEIRYFEEWDSERIKELIENGEFLLLPNEKFRETILEAYRNKKLIFSEGENKHE